MTAMLPALKPRLKDPLDGAAFFFQGWVLVRVCPYSCVEEATMFRLRLMDYGPDRDR